MDGTWLPVLIHVISTCIVCVPPSSFLVLNTAIMIPSPSSSWASPCTAPGTPCTPPPASSCTPSASSSWSPCCCASAGLPATTDRSHYPQQLFLLPPWLLTSWPIPPPAFLHRRPYLLRHFCPDGNFLFSFFLFSSYFYKITKISFFTVYWRGATHWLPMRGSNSYRHFI